MISSTPQTIIDHRYLLLKQLGQGGMGTVYQARDRLSGAVVALKQVTTPAQQLSFGSQGDGDARLALTQEFRLLARLRHPNIISVLDYGFDGCNSQPYFTMTLIENARDVFQVARQEDFAGKLDLLIQILQALMYLHRHDLLHRDLKPGNVLVTPDRQVRLVDFGLAVELKQANGIIGSLIYVAPEVLNDQPVSTASDLYAVGVMAYEFFTGKHPFAAASLQFMLQQALSTPADRQFLLEHVEHNEALADVILRLLAKDPAERYHRASDVILDLCAAVGQTPPSESSLIRDSYLQTAPFTGREVELEQLTAALHQNMHGQGSAWLLEGESGVGKSRLLEELRIRALVEGALLVSGHGSQDGMPYQLWRTVLPPLALTADLNPDDLQVLLAAVPELQQLIDTPLTPIEKDEDFQQLLTLAIAGVFQRQERPVVLLLDDLQWAADSLPALRHLCNLAPTLPLLIVGTYRSDEYPYLYGKLPTAQVISLQRFSRSKIAEISQSILGESSNSAPLQDLLWRETEGNIFYIVEVLRVLAEKAGRLDQIHTITLPEQVFARELIAIARQRLSRLPGSDHPLLRVAAVAGRKIDFNLLEYIDPKFDQAEWLMRCVDAALLEISGGQWYFTHDKIRQGLLFDLEPAELRRLHRLVAEALEVIYLDSPDYAQQLVHHWHQAGNLPQEAHYTLIYTRQLILANNYQEAQTLLKALLEQVPDLPAEQQISYRIQLLKQLGDTCEGLDEYAQANDCYERSLELAYEYEDLHSAAAALVALGKIALRWGHAHRAEHYYAESLTLNQRLGSASGIAASLNGMGTVLRELNRYSEARDYFEQSVTLSRELNDLPALAQGINYIGIIMAEMGDYETSRTYFEQALEVRRKYSDRRGIAAGLSNLAKLMVRQGDLATAQAYNLQSLALKQEINDRSGISGTLHNMAEAAESGGDYRQALEYYQQSLTLVREIRNAPHIIHRLTDLVIICIKMNDLDQARAYFAEALALARKSELEHDFLRVIWAALFFMLAAGKYEIAAEWLGLVGLHPRHDAEMQERIPAVQLELEAKLGAAATADLLAHGQDLTIEMVINEIIASI